MTIGIKLDILIQLAHQPGKDFSELENALVGHDNVALDALFEKVHREGGYDFREYKRGTVMRRLGRRLHE